MTMRFTEITPEDFRAYAAASPYKSFMQTPEIAEYRAKNGWTPYYFAVKDREDHILAATMLVAKPTFLGKSTFIAPGGPLLDLENTELTRFFFKNLHHYIKSHNGYVLRISPYYELVERDRDGTLVENGFNHQQAVKNLTDLGFIRVDAPDQPEFMFATDLAGKTTDDLFKSFKTNTRGHIRKAEKKGVTVRELKREELNILKGITASTAARRDFTDKPLEYYEQMYDLFTPRGEAMFLAAEAQGTPLSAAMFMLAGDEVVYLFSGSDEKYMHDYNAQYAIQWYMMQYAVDHGYKRYNFYGIHGLPDDSHRDGVYEFKKGFTGQVLQFIGTYELPVDVLLYNLHKLLKKIKK